MKNKLIIAMLLIAFGYKNSTAQITQSTVRSTNTNAANINVHQYSVTLTEDTTHKVRAPYGNSPTLDDYWYPYYNLVITGKPNDTASVTLVFVEKNIPSSSNNNTPFYALPVIIILDNYGYASYTLNRDNSKSTNSNLAERKLSYQYIEKIIPRINYGYIGTNHYKLYAAVFYFNKDLRDKKLESMVVF